MQCISLLLVICALAHVATAASISKDRAKAMLAKMSLEEKVDLLHGRNFEVSGWESAPSAYQVFSFDQEVDIPLCL